jgi:hypothetical protein
MKSQYIVPIEVKMRIAEYTYERLSQFLNEWNDQSGQGVVLIALGPIF